MYVEILGAGTTNKGAELMLAAVADRFHRRSEVKLVAPPYIGPYETRARYGLYQTFDARTAGRLGRLIEAVVSPGYRKRYGLVHPRTISATLDVSGFLIGDQFPVKWARARALEFRRRKGNGQTIIMLPQSFGPFSNREVAAAAREVLQLADLIFVRDGQSMEHMHSILPDLPSVRRASDFTNLLEGKNAGMRAPGERPAAIVPNIQVLKFGQSGASSAYKEFLVGVAKHLRDAGCTPFVIIHEARADRGIAREIAAAAALPCIQEDDPLVLKGLIGECHIMVGSRFHALVGALSQGVPAIGVSWSHKYEALFAEYERPHWLVSPTQPDTAAALAKGILANLPLERGHLLERSAVLKRQTEEMWQIVEGRLLGEKAPHKPGATHEAAARSPSSSVAVPA